MTKTAKITLWVVVILAVIGLAWWWMATYGQGAMPGSTSSSMSETSAPAGSIATSTVPPASAIVSTGTSDAALNQDMTNINAQLNGLASDTASVDVGVASSSAAAQ